MSEKKKDNKNPKGAAPKAPPCRFPFGKDFLCFGLISGAHSGPILIFPPPFSRKGFSSVLGAPRKAVK